MALAQPLCSCLPTGGTATAAGTKAEPVGQGGCPRPPAGTRRCPSRALGPGGCSDPPKAAQSGRWQSWGGPSTLGRGCPGAPGPASAPTAGCPRVNESLLLLQTISDIFADNATLSLCRLPGSTSPAAPAAPLGRLPSAPRSGRHRAPHPAPRPAPRPDTSAGGARQRCNPKRSSRLPSLPSDPLLLWKLHPT